MSVLAAPLSQSEVSEQEIEDDDKQRLNPELIGANKALQEGDLDKYTKIANGLQNYDLNQLIKDEETTAVDDLTNDTELEI